MSAITVIAIANSSDSRSDEVAKAPASRKAELGQFMTPPSVAEFMSEKFDPKRMVDVVLLDAGAGQGSLCTAFAERWARIDSKPSQLSIDAYELDEAMIELLKPKMRSLEADRRIKTKVVAGDFIENAVKQILRRENPYTHAILNPPYKKIRNNSQARLTLASVGVETVNLYSGFVALSIELVEKEGEVVAIIPRSFCNGPYYKAFREFMLERTAIKSIHLFDTRDRAFAADNVLQENVIIHLQKSVKQRDVVISKSADAGFGDIRIETVPFSKIVLSGDGEKFIHIPTEAGQNASKSLAAYTCSLQDLGISVSTGPVVDFRLKTHLRMLPTSVDAPLLYPGHFAGGKLLWPRNDFKKPNAIAINEATQRWLFPSGFYVAVKRFTSKEEKRRIVATLVDPTDLPKSPIGFENHLNIYHENRGSLTEELARGIVAYLNTQTVDDWFRQFNGHTQVNATDLRSLVYPNRDALIELGRVRTTKTASGQREFDFVE